MHPNMVNPGKKTTLKSIRVFQEKLENNKQKQKTEDPGLPAQTRCVITTHMTDGSSACDADHYVNNQTGSFKICKI